MKSVIDVFAPAKVNLYLHVTGRRADGYHLLDSLIVFAGVGDTICFAPADELSLTVEGPQAAKLSAEPDNLVLRAARRLAEAAGRTAGAAITLIKRLPVAAGIGGGSADAAAALLGLTKLWDLGMDQAQLARIGLSLGADLPVCLAGVASRVSGIGEILEAAPPLPPTWLVLVNPGIGLSTPAVFKARNAPFSAAAPLAGPPADAAALTRELAARRNDLTDAAVALLPLIGTLLDALAAQRDCLLARMSGSGATCFGVFADQAAADSAAERLSRDHPAWWIAAAPLVERSVVASGPRLSYGAGLSGGA
jgi:4-diphosphocytidyl-2-C-methyl-D-erythritol kinase